MGPRTLASCLTLAAAFAAPSLAFAGAESGSPCPCTTDFDFDGVTGASDLALLLGAWGDTGFSDLDANGITDPTDLAILLGAWGPCAAVPNDECSSAILLEGVSLAEPICNASATDSAVSFPTTCGADADAAAIGKDIWYRYVMPYEGALIVHTYDSAFDTVLGVYSNLITGACGCPGQSATATLLACDDDANGQLQSFVEVLASQGQCMNIRVGGYRDSAGSSDSGPGLLTIRPIKRGDRCDLAHVLPGGTFVEVDGTNSGDTWIQADLSSCASNDTLDEWYRFTMPCDGEVTISTCDAMTNFDTTLSVFTECGGPEIACNDDFIDPDCTIGVNMRKSRVTLIGSSGEVFYIRVSGFNSATGDFRLILDVDCVG